MSWQGCAKIGRGLCLIFRFLIFFFNHVFVIFLNSFSARFVTAVVSKIRLGQDMCWSRLNLVEVLRALTVSWIQRCIREALIWCSLLNTIHNDHHQHHHYHHHHHHDYHHDHHESKIRSLLKTICNMMPVMMMTVVIIYHNSLQEQITQDNLSLFYFEPTQQILQTTPTIMLHYKFHRFFAISTGRPGRWQSPFHPPRNTNRVFKAFSHLAKFSLRCKQ